MNQDLFVAVERHVEELFIGHGAALDAALTASRSAGRPTIHLSPVQRRLLDLLAQLTRARRILEIGTLGGYSTSCLARALPADGLLASLEPEPRHAEVLR